MNMKAMQTTHPLFRKLCQRDWIEGLFGESVWTYLSVRLPCPSTSKTRMPLAIIVSVNKNICRIQSGVNVHELQVLRGYDMSGATIHDVQPWRAVAVDFCNFPGFSICPVFSIAMFVSPSCLVKS